MKPMENKKKLCAGCNELKFIWKNISGCKYCKECSYKEIKPKGISKAIKPKGELSLFLDLYKERGDRCQITGEWIAFNVSCFMHILSKGAYESYRLNPANILIVKKEIHELYDCSSKEKLLKEYPNASIIYELKDQLRYEYYNGIKKS